MLKQLQLKKEYGLAMATIILLLVSYELAFKTTADAWQLHRALKTELTKANDVSLQPAYLERKNNNLNKIIALYKADTVNFRSNILSTISSVADHDNVKLSEVPLQDAIYRNPQFIVEKLSFEGDYFDLLKTLNQLQSTVRIGMIRSVALRSVGVHMGSGDARKLVMEVCWEIAVN
jgi:hypothetical protein